MPSTSTDRLNGANASLAVKAPVRAVATSNITLSGEQTVGSVAVTSGQRVLVTGQTDASENGIYVVSTSSWTRAPDFDGNLDVVKGTLVVVQPSTGADVFYQVTSDDPTIGTDDINFALINNPNVTYPETPAETTAGLSVTNTSYPEGNVLRYGADPTGVADSSLAFGGVLEAGGFDIYIPAGTYLVDPDTVDSTDHILIGSNTRIYCEPGVTVRIPDGGGLIANRGFMRFRDVENCVVVGNYSVWEYETKPTADEQRHIWAIQGATNIVLRDLVSKKAGGDGFYVGAGAVNNYSQSIVLDNCRADNCRRQGLSIVSAIDLRADNFIGENITGTAPQSGIDIEPNVSTDELKGIRINSPVTRNCENYGIKAFINDLPSGYELDVVINGHLSDGDGVSGFQAQYGTTMEGRIAYNDAIIIDAGLNGIDVRGWQSDSALVEINRPTIVNPNADNTAAANFGNGIGIYATVDDTVQTDIGNIIIREPVIVDNRGTGRMQDGIRASTDVAGGVVRDVSIIDPIEISGYGASDDPVSLLRVINYLVTDRHRILERAHTSNGNVSISDHYSIETNEGAAGTVVLTLDNDIEPGPSLFTFEVKAAQTLAIDPEVGSSILPGGASGVRIESATVGARLALRRESATAWHIVEQHGDWSFTAGPQAISSDGTTGGSASAGAGNQYVELTIGGTTYKVLHDGTV